MEENEKIKIKNMMRTIPNFPEGIIFRDITTILKNKESLEIVMQVHGKI